MIEGPAAAIMSKGLGLAGNTQGSEAAIAMTAQGTNLANSMVKANRVTDAQAARAAEHTEAAINNRLKPKIASKRNFPQTKRKALGPKASQVEDSEGIATDAAWKFTGAQAIAFDQGEEGGQNSDPWSIATSAKKLNQIDPNYIGNNLNLAA